ncbi:MAG TPA: Nif3-like dinuclear metal center hexameric protein [Gemmatimonadales bacterium]|nr:Nif3-like dinuclear metal center hexameric protein [Gemmatimonadales bacterium]
MKTVPLAELVEYLDTYLRIREVADDPAALNGLQVECQAPIARIVAAVDASQATIDRVRAEAPAPGGTTLILVHHGLYWDGNLPATGRRYRRLRALIEGDIALYSAHLPLDLHPELGNNVLLARALQLDIQGWFGLYRGTAIGVRGRLPQPEHRDALVNRLAAVLKGPASEITVIPGGPATVERIGIITGAASRELSAAREAGVDTYITGEGPHHSYFDAMESGMNLIFGGHYRTERFGVEALAHHLGERYGLPWAFHDHPTGL